MRCGPIIIYPPCPSPTCPEQIVYSSANGNLTGVGVLDSNTSSLGTFRGIVGDGVYIATTLDAPNKSVIVSLIAAAIPAAVPQATETVAGKGEVATQIETNASVSDTTFVTPQKLGARIATEVLSGLLSVATNADVTTGTSDLRIVTPLKLANRLATIKQTTTWANAAARAAATPAFDGQVGLQLDTNVFYVATGVAVGNWQQAFIEINGANTLTSTTSINTAGGADLWFGFSGVPYLTIASTGIALSGTTFTVASAANLTIAGGGILNFGALSLIKSAGTTVPASSVLGTTGTAGEFTSRLLNTFISTANVQTGWGTPTGVLTRTAFDASTVTLSGLGERLAALITDLKAKLLPAT